MPMNEQLKARVNGIREGLMAHYHATRLLPNAAKGDEREALVGGFFERVFPAPYRFGRGAITDASGAISGQLDSIVEWPFFASFPGPLGIDRFYVAESVAFVIEVKSDLRTQWEQVRNTVRQVRPLRRHWRTYIALNAERTDTEFLGPTISRIPSVAVGYTGFDNIEALQARMSATPEGERPDAALVIDSGAYVSPYSTAATGEEGLFSFCMDCSYFVRNVLFAEPDLALYVSGVVSMLNSMINFQPCGNQGPL